jgi:glycosyltransferase involved in cell wall biosynthesis
MRIGLLHNSVLPPKTYGGIERIVMALAKEFTRLGHQPVLFCRKGSLTEKDYETVFLPDGYDGEDLSNLIPSDLDFLHSHQPLKVKPPKPFVVTIHGNGHPEEKYFPNTNFLSQSHARNHNAKYFIYNGVEPEVYPYQEKKQDYFVFLAKTTWRVKNVKTAIAWAQDLGLRLEIMGGSGVSRGGIHYNGMTDEPEKRKLLAGAKALIYPTNWDEPCAAAPLEALACGTPVITSVNGCMPELVRPGTGVVCKDYRELLDAALAVEKLSPKACRESVENFFSLRRMTQDYLNLFNVILEKGELDHQPRYNFNKESVKLLYKPTIVNRMRIAVTGKV